MNKRKMFLRMITASLIRRRSRMLVALLSIAIGAAILSGLVTIYVDVPRQMGAQFRNYGANMIFTPTDGQFTSEDITNGISFIESADIVGVTPYRYESVRIHELPVMAAGTDMEQAKLTSPYWSVEGAYPSGSGQLLLGASLAEQFRLGIGDEVTVNYTPESGDTGENGTVADNMKDMTVAGILETGGPEEDYVYISMSDLEELTGVSGKIDLAELSVSARSEKLKEYAEAISANVTGVSARLVKRVTESESTVLTKLQALVLLVTVVVLALTMICVATTMTAVVTERRREIGLRKAIGASNAGIIAEFMGEGIMLGAAGGIIGVILGFIFAQQVSINVFSSSISFMPLLVPITILVSVAVTGVSCLLPIRSATQIDPALVLKGE
ncbi:MAG: ABC transporter permease [Ruminiclostridium sp.]|nr:ABC transporter permease [Ruminiclostridium sp.]